MTLTKLTKFKFVFFISLFAVPCTYCRPRKLGFASVRDTANQAIKNVKFQQKGKKQKS